MAKYPNTASGKLIGLDTLLEIVEGDNAKSHN